MILRHILFSLQEIKIYHYITMSSIKRSKSINISFLTHKKVKGKVLFTWKHFSLCDAITAAEGMDFWYVLLHICSASSHQAFFIWPAYAHIDRSHFLSLFVNQPDWTRGSLVRSFWIFTKQKLSGWQIRKTKGWTHTCFLPKKYPETILAHLWCPPRPVQPTLFAKWA